MKKITWYKIFGIIPALLISDGVWESVGWPMAEVFLGLYMIPFLTACIVCEKWD